MESGLGRSLFTFLFITIHEGLRPSTHSFEDPDFLLLDSILYFILHSLHALGTLPEHLYRLYLYQSNFWRWHATCMAQAVPAHGVILELVCPSVDQSS